MSFCSNPFTGQLTSLNRAPVVELRQTANGIYYIMLNGVEQQNTFTLDYDLAYKFYEIAAGEYKNNQAEDIILKSNVEATN